MRRPGPWIWLALVLAATLLVHVRSLAGEFVYDDEHLIVRNPLITELSNVGRIFSSGYWDFQPEAERYPYWRPLTALLHALVWQISGTDPRGYHALSLAVHLAATALVFLLALRLASSAWVAAFAALFFGLHPAQVEGVAWVSGLNDPLCGLFVLAALCLHLAWRQRGSSGIPIAPAIACAFALLSKEQGVATLPLVLALDVGRKREASEPAGLLGGCGSPGRAYGPLLAVLGLYVLARMIVFESPLAGAERIKPFVGVGLAQLFTMRLEIFGGALEILAWPFRLSAFRPLRALDFFDPPLLRAACWTLLLALAIGLCAWRGRRPALAALLVIPCALLPVFVRVEALGGFPLADRYLYLPVLGFGLFLALELVRLPRAAATGLALIVAGLYAARSHERIGAWRDDETFYRHASADSPRSVTVWLGLGRILLEKVGATGDPAVLKEAFSVFERAQELLIEAKQEDSDLVFGSRDYVQANLGLAWCFIYESRLDRSQDAGTAIAMLEQLVERILEFQRGAEEARALGIRTLSGTNDLEGVYTALGVAHLVSGRLAEGEAALRKALAENPDYPEAHRNLGEIYKAQGRLAEAAREFEAAWRLRPGNLEDELALAQVLQTTGQGARAEELALELVDALPARVEPRLILAALRLEKGNASDALAWIDRALAIDRRHGFAWYMRAQALLMRKEPQEALTAFRNAVELMPDNFEAHYNFGAFLAESGALDLATPMLVRAYVLSPPEHAAALRNALERLPALEVPALLELAAAAARRKEASAEGAWLDRALALSPADSAVLLAKARFLRRSEHHDEAVALWKEVCALRPTSFAEWSDLGAYLHSLGRDAEALPYLERALELDVPADWPSELRESAKQGIRSQLAEMGTAAPPPGSGSR